LELSCGLSAFFWSYCILSMVCSRWKCLEHMFLSDVIISIIQSRLYLSLIAFNIIDFGNINQFFSSLLDLTQVDLLFRINFLSTWHELDHLSTWHELDHLSTWLELGNLSTWTCQLDLNSTTYQLDLNSTTYQLDFNSTTCQLDLNSTTCQLDLNSTTCQLDFNSTTCQLDFNSTTCQLDLNSTKRLANNFYMKARFKFESTRSWF
jgi:hypothetical protein